MKKLIMIGGTMGVGKTTLCQALKKELNHCVFFRWRLVLGYASFCCE